jgi:hypothetical protein
MTLFESFSVTFNVVFEANLLSITANLLSITEVVSKNPVFALITLTCHRLNENTSGPDLLAHFVK